MSRLLERMKESRKRGPSIAGVVLARLSFFKEFGWANQSDKEAIPSGPSELLETSSAGTKRRKKRKKKRLNLEREEKKGEKNNKKPQLVNVAEMCRFRFNAVERAGTA